MILLFLLGGIIMNLYTKEGWLNVPAIDKLNAPFNILIGSRQIGKTYGTLLLMLKERRQFIYSRRTVSELEFATGDNENPFNAYAPYYDVTFKKNNKYTYSIYNNDGTEEEKDFRYIGMGCSLVSVAKIRGMNTDGFTDWVYDEFIPEKHVQKIAFEGDAFANAYVSFNGNRELKGRPPLKTWLLANSNNLNSPVLSTLDVIGKIESMKAKGQEFSYLENRGIVIVLPRAEQITEMRSKSALYRAIGTDSKFAEMSLNNEFSYNDFSGIGRTNIEEFKLDFILDGICFYKHKVDGSWYCTEFKTGVPKFVVPNDDKLKTFMRTNYPSLMLLYDLRKMKFDCFETKSKVLDIFSKIY